MGSRSAILERRQGWRYRSDMGTARLSEEHGRQAADVRSSTDGLGRPSDVDALGLTANERSQIAARLRLSPSERLRYLEDMIAFEALARRARRVT
jgi:hypothetical protein